MKLKSIYLIIRINFSFLKQYFRNNYKSNKIKNRARSIKSFLRISNKKLFIIDMNSLGASITSVCYLEYLIKKKYIKKDKVIILSNKNNLNLFWFKKINENYNIKRLDRLTRFIKTHSCLFRGILINFPFDGTNYSNKNFFKISFSNEEKKIGKKILKKLKIYKKKIVTITYKSNTYWQKIRNTNKDFERYRLSNVKNLKNTINYLLKNNYTVIFTGEPSNLDKKFLKGVLFYDNLSLYEKNFFDFYVYKIAMFSIIGHSGDLAFTQIFNVPVLHHNAIHPQYPKKGVILFKSFYNAKTQKKLNFNDLFKIKKLHYFSDSTFPFWKKIPLVHFKNNLYFELNNVMIKENSNEEIKAALEFLLKNLNKKTFKYQNKYDIIFYKNRINNSIKKFIKNKYIKYLNLN